MQENQPDYKAEFFENSEMLISIYDKDLNLIDANSAFLKLLRFEKKDIIGKNINEISPDCKPSGRYTIYEEIIRTGKRFVTDQIRLHPSLGNIYVRLTAFKVGDGLGISSKDITDLIETIEDLESFIYKTSHDVRAPISTMLGLINIAQQDLHDNPVALSYISKFKYQTEKLNNITTQLVETTKIRQADKTLQLIHFEEEIRKIITSFNTMPGIDNTHFNLNIAHAGKFYSSKHLVTTIFQNLIHNAIKYRDESKSKWAVNITTKDHDNGILITIEDNGIGIGEASQDDVFKMFFRGTTKASGSGLGLFTAKQCIKKLGGTIKMKSKLKEGTSFEIYLPAGQ